MEILEAVLLRCTEKGLFLSWQKYQFMVNKEIVLGHIVFAEGNKVNQAKADLTLKLPKPSTITGGSPIYRGMLVFTEDLSLLKDTQFCWNNYCQKTFDVLKEKLNSTPIIRPPN